MGFNIGGTIEKSNATGDVIFSSGNNIGGLVGYNILGYTTVNQSYATGNVEGNENVGGLIGYNEHDSVINSYAVGDVTGTTNVGGLVGHNTGSLAEVNLSYAAGSVSGITNVNGLIGFNESRAIVENSYWDVEATGQDSSAGIGDENGLDTAEMQGDAASSNMEGFDFTTTWSVIDTFTEISYPLLQENTQKYASFSKPKQETETKSGSSTRTSVGQSQSPETVKNTDSTIKKVLTGSNVKYDFSDSEGPVMGIRFDAKDNEGNVVAKVQILKDKPDDVDAPSGNSYKLMSINVGSEGTITEGNADNILIEFKVSKEWIEENNIDPSTIRMTRFHDGEWQDLPSNQVGEDDEYFYFTAETPGFSVFSIVGDEMKEEVIEEEPATEQQSPSEEVEEPASEEESAQTPGFTAIFAVALIAGAAFVMRKD